MDGDNLIDVERSINDRLYYIENCLWIRTKEEALVPFKLNRPQRRVHNLVTSLEASNRPIRLICLKARQMGMSTLFGGLLFKKTSTKRFVNTAVTAHKDDPAVNLFGMYSLFYKMLPNEVRPMKKYSSKRELLFENPRPDPTKGGTDLGLQSRLSVFTGGSEDLSRSRTIHNLHWSEVAFTKGAEDVHGVTLSAVPKPPAPSMVFYESTANGPSGLFHDLFWESWEGKNDWTAVFLPWHLMEEYALPVDNHFVLDEGEVALKELYDLTDEQLAWRRYVLLNDFRGNESKFMQEYPACPEEAFQSSINAVFDLDALREMENDIKEPIAYASIKEEGLREYRSVPPKDSEGVVRGYLHVWNWPAKGTKYVMCIDAAGGGSDGDYLVCHILGLFDDRIEQVAMYTDKIHPSQFAVHCAWLGYAYNYALASPERNAHGAAVVGMLLDKGYYKMHRDESGEYGININSVNKYELVGMLARVIWQRNLVIHDRTTLVCLRSYQERNNRFYGKMDDFVDALRVGIPAAPKAYLSTTQQKEAPIKHEDWDISHWTNEDMDAYIQRNARRAL